jgi:hypothetical protein
MLCLLTYDPPQKIKIKTIKNVVKSLVMLEIQSQENITKQAAYIYCQPKFS